MKILLKIAFIAVLVFLLGMYLPWWSVAIASFLINVILYSKGTSSFFAGFLGVALVWFVQAFMIDMATDSILTNKVAAIFSLPNAVILVGVTAVIGGLAGGFSGLAGSHFRTLLTKRKYDSKYIQ